MRAGDVVRWQPDNSAVPAETWIVAYERDGLVAPYGWPDCVVPVRQCSLMSAATDAEHEAALREIAASGGRRGVICEEQLLALLERRDEFVRVRPVTTVHFERVTPPRAVPRGHCGRCDRCGWSLGETTHRCAKGPGCSVRPLPPLRSHCAGCGAPYEEGDSR